MSEEKEKLARKKAIGIATKLMLAGVRIVLPQKPSGSPLPEDDGPILGHLPKSGDAWNPMRKFPTNHPCFCASGKKFKKCCRDKLSLAIPEKTAKKLIANWDRLLNGELVIKAEAKPEEETAILTSNDKDFFDDQQ